jgi:tetratricopeptide (TPR) repeat protein
MKKYKIRSISFLVTVVLLMGLSACGNAGALETQLEYREQGLTLMSEGKYAQAVNTFQNALNQTKTVRNLEVDIAYYKALAQFRSGDIEGSMETYNALISYDKRNAQAYYLRGCLFLKQGDTENAKKDFQSAMEYGKNNYALFIGIAENLQSAGFEEEAKSALNQTLSWNAKTIEEFRYLGDVYLLLGDYDMARQYLDKAAVQGDPMAVLYLAQVYEAMGQPEQAQTMYDAFLQQNAGNAEALNDLGTKQMEVGNFDKALEFFQAALAVEGSLDTRELRRNEIIALEHKLDFAGARERLELFVADYPEDQEAARELIFLQTR